MSDSTPDRFSIPDETAVIRGSSEAGFIGDWDDIFHSEELDTETFLKGNRIPGGGINGIDLLFNDPDNVDPELKHLYDEFLVAKYQLKSNDAYGIGVKDKSEEELAREFSSWLLDESDEKKNNKEWSLKIKLDEVGYDSETAEKFMELTKIWSNEDTVVNYLVKNDGESDILTFIGKTHDSHNVGDNTKTEKTISLSKEEMNRALEKSGIRLRIPRPRNEREAESVIWTLNHLRIGLTPFQGSKIEVEHDDVPEVAHEVAEKPVKPLIVLKSDVEGYAAKKLESTDLENGRKFLEAWRNGGVRQVGLGFTDKSLDTIALNLGDGQVVKTNRDTLAAMLPGVSRTNYDDVSGISFQNPDGHHSKIVLDTRTEMNDMAGILSQLEIDGVRLNPGFGVVKAQRSKVEEPFVKVDEVARV